jgi:hypothetical protein
LGNIVGALLVGLPAVYFYLSDYDVAGLRNAEAGMVEGREGTPSDLSNEKTR